MKNEEILKIEDLVDGGYYKATFKENQKGLIFLLNNKIGENYYHYFISLEDNYFQKDNILTSRPEENIYTKLNQKEIFWLNECIKANKFINYETAMKTFVEEDELYDITNLTPYPENYTDCKKGDKVVLVNYTSKTSKDTKIPLGSVLTINQDNNQIPYVLCKEQIYCVSISQVAPIPDEEQKEEVMKEKTEFKKGDYIVTLISSPDGGPSAIKNYCFKQRCDSKYLKNVLDTKNNTNNGNTGINFSDKSNTLAFSYPNSLPKVSLISFIAFTPCSPTVN